MDSELQGILVESVKLEAENIILKRLSKQFKSDQEINEQLNNMMHYNKQVRT